MYNEGKRLWWKQIQIIVGFFLLIYLAVFYCMLVFLDCDAKIIK